MQASLVSLLLHVALMTSSVVECAESGQQQHDGLNIVDLGRSVTFTCVSNSPGEVQWSFHPGSGDSIHLYAAGTLTHDDDRYSIKTNIRGRYDLIIDNVTASAAGRYICIDDDGFGDKLLDVNLVVLLDPGMSCSTNASVDGVVVEHDVVEYACELCYGGTAEPMFRWTDRNGNQVTSGMSVVPKNEVRCARSYVAVTVGTEKLGQVTCDVSFDGRTANTSGVRRRTFDELPVQFPVRNVIITNATRSGVLHIHRWETLVCSADGQPEVKYRWTDVISGHQTDGDLLVLNDTGKHEFQCSAWNVVRNVTYNVSCSVSVSVVEEQGQDLMRPKAEKSIYDDRRQHMDNPMVFGLVGVGAVCGISLLVVVLVLSKRRRRESSEPKDEGIATSSLLVCQDTRTNCLIYDEIAACRRPVVSYDVAWESHSGEPAPPPKTDNLHDGDPGMLKDTSDYLTVQIPLRSPTQCVQYVPGATGPALGCHGPGGGSFDGRYFVERNASRETQPCYYGNILYGEDIHEMDRDDDGVYLHTLE